MRKYSAYLGVTLLIMALLSGRAFGYQADVENISQEKYFPAVKEAMGQAKQSIYMVMFKVNLQPYDDGSSIAQLVNELIVAHKRGVNVTVILDQNIEFSGGDYIDEWQVEGKNAWCFKALKEAGINVRYDDPTTYTHAKIIVIDGKTIIIGSANWTRSALFKNFEANVLIKSEKLANEFLEDFKKIKIDEGASGPDDEAGLFLPLSWKFLENPKLAGSMVTQNDNRSLDVYLLVLRSYYEKALKDVGKPPGATIIFDYDKIADHLGMNEQMDRVAYRRQLTKILRKLETRYKLIKFEPQFAKNATIALLDYNDPNEPYSPPKGWYFQIPANYWNYGWDRSFSLSAKFSYFINLAYSSISNARPWWFASLETLSKRFNVSQGTITKGMQELRRLNIIDVAYPPLDETASNRTQTKSYKVLNLYNPEWLEREWKRLGQAYGEEKLDKAREYAKIVFKENDPQDIEEIIAAMNAQGEEAVKEAFAIVAKKNIDNPKRTFAYVKGILAKWREEKEGK